MKRKKFLVIGKSICVALTLLAVPLIGASATQDNASNWYGLPLPGPVTDAELLNGTIPPLASPFAGSVPAIDGDEAHRWMSEIVNFSFAQRDRGEQFWGRWAGSRPYEEAIDYIEQEIRSWDIKVYRKKVLFYGPERLPTKFGAQLELVDKDGNSLNQISLRSAHPARYSPTQSANGGTELGMLNLTAHAEVISVGRGSLVDISTQNLEGKIAVVTLPSEPHPAYNGTRHIFELVKQAGAVGLIFAWNTPGNMQINLGFCKDIPCINLGGRDGAFLRAVLARVSNSPNKLLAHLSITTQTEANKEASILYVKVPGLSSAHNIIVTAHADGPLAGANDNASGVAILMSMLKHYKDNPTPYDLYFHVSPGHHSNIQAIRRFVEMHPALPKLNILSINIEHVAQRGIVRSNYSIVDQNLPRNYDDEAQVYEFTNTRSPYREIQVSHMNETYLDIIRDVVARHRMPVPSRFIKSTFADEIGPVADAGGITIQPVEVSLVYHTSGDTAETVSPEGLEAQALFYLDLINTISKYDKDTILRN